jgi:hypothetical protein
LIGQILPIEGLADRLGLVSVTWALTRSSFPDPGLSCQRPFQDATGERSAAPGKSPSSGLAPNFFRYTRKDADPPRPSQYVPHHSLSKGVCLLNRCVDRHLDVMKSERESQKASENLLIANRRLLVVGRLTRHYV